MDTLLMNTRARRRMTVLSQVKEGVIGVGQAARLMDVSKRQAFRIWKQYRERGDAGLIHGLQGRPGNAAHGDLKQKVLAAYRATYQGFSAAHAAEFLARQNLSVPRTTCWRWVKADGQLPNARRIKQHRQRRERKHSPGELVQMDGSTHAWFGPELPAAVLFVMIDDASSRVYARFYATEDTTTAFDLFGRYTRGFGLPLALYVDRDSIYKVNDPQALQQARETGRKTPLTQFGRAMQTLGVNVIFAQSPQAKGRVERVNRTFQDRLVKELKLMGIVTIQKANAYLDHTFLKSINALIGKTPASGANLHQRLPTHVKLEEVLCHIEYRSVGQDWCVTYGQRILQIRRQHEALSLAGKRIAVLEHADGTLKLMHQDQSLTFTEVAARPLPTPAPRPALSMPTHHRPHAAHPWKQSYKTPPRQLAGSTQ
jgi:hypothetical protein